MGHTNTSVTERCYVEFRNIQIYPKSRRKNQSIYSERFFIMSNYKKNVDDRVILKTETLQQIISDAIEKA